MKRAPETKTNLFIRGGQVVDPAHGLDDPLDILVENGVIVSIERNKTLEKRAKQIGAQLVDAKDCIVSPGFVDLNARLGEPGSDPSECIASGSASAAAGGFASVACMPGFASINDNAFLTDYILRHAQEKSVVRLFPVGALTLGSKGEKLSEMGIMRDAGVVALADDGRPVMDAYLMRKALEYAKAFQLPIFSFPQDKNLVGKGVMDEGVQSCKLGLRGIPAAAEEILVARDLVLAKHTDGRLHFSTISTKGAVNAVREAKSRGQTVSCETSPQYFTLNSSDVVSYDARFKFFPPLRSKEHLDAVIDGLADGTIDAISSANTPQSPSSKDMVFEQASAGMIGFETVLPLGLDLVSHGKLTLERLVYLLTHGPAQILGLEKKGIGALKLDGPADITIFDPQASYVYQEERIVSPAKNTPFLGRKLQGKIRYTIVGGAIAFAAQTEKGARKA